MANALFIANETINGIVHGTLPEPPELQRREVKYWGVVGALELQGGIGARDFEVRMTVFNNYNVLTLLAALKRWDALVGAHSNVSISNIDNGLSRSFRNSTFLGFVRGTDPTDGPVPDIAGTLDGGWWITGTFKFRQLTNKQD